MNVAAILREKGRAVTTASPVTTLLEVASKLAAKRIGSVVIVGTNGRVAGIISERDIIRALSTQGPDCLTRPVSESMTRAVIGCQETDTVDELMEMMTERRCRHLPVITDDEALVGIISIGDVVKHRVVEVTMEATAMREYITHC
jgi:CBS domain-containing protein